MSGPAKPKLRHVLDPELAHILSHPLRAHILTVLNERKASPNEIAREIDVAVSDVSYHARKLREEGYIKLVETRRRRGALEHFYEAIETLLIDDEEWARIPDSVKPSMAAKLLRAIVDDSVQALETGAMIERDDYHLSRCAMPLDEKGWADLSAQLAKTLDRVLEIKRESAARLLESGEDGSRALVLLGGFEQHVEASESLGD